MKFGCSVHAFSQRNLASLAAKLWLTPTSAHPGEHGFPCRRRCAKIWSSLSSMVSTSVMPRSGWQLGLAPPSTHSRAPVRTDRRGADGEREGFRRSPPGRARIRCTVARRSRAAEQAADSAWGVRAKRAVLCDRRKCNRPQSFKVLIKSHCRRSAAAAG